jgi:hypothetical protein
VASWPYAGIRKGEEVRRTVSLLLVAMVMVLVMPGGVALAVTATCTVIRPCKGTEGPDTIVSTDGRADEILDPR